jgi:cytosine/uracil/thiamine/allantoin permease
MTTIASVTVLASTARVTARSGRGPHRACASLLSRRVRAPAFFSFGAVRTSIVRATLGDTRRDRPRRGRLAQPIRPDAVKGDDLPEWLDDQRWNVVMDTANASGDEAEDGAAMALASDYASGDPLEYDRSFALWICTAVSAVVYSVPFGFVRWNLSSLAPLVWWQLGLSTAVGTLLAMPLIAMITVPAARHDVNFPILARASFGVRGALLADAGRGALGLFLFTLITLAGGEAVLSFLSALVNDGVVFDGILANPATFLGTAERALAYLIFWGAQVLLASVGPDARLMVCARAAVIAVIGAASKTIVDGIAEAAALGATAPFPLPPEFWAHAVLTTGVWFTLSAMLPDYARRAANAVSFVKAQALWLPALAGLAAIAGSGVASAPAAFGLPVVIAACLVTNATAASVGPVASIRAIKPMSGKLASTLVAVAALAAAPLAFSWQQVIAASSWVVGVGSLLVAPAIGVMLADFWVTQGRTIETAELFKVPQAGWASDPEWENRADAYWYRNGVHVRAVFAAFIGAAPNMFSLFSGLAAMLKTTGQMRLNLYVVNSEYSSILGAALAAATYLLSFAVSAAMQWARPALIRALVFLVKIPKRVTDAGALRARKRLEAALAMRAAKANAVDAQGWIDEWRVDRGLTAGPETVRALRTIGTSNVARNMDLSRRKRAADANRALEIAMNKPDVVAARVAVTAARKEAEMAVTRFEEAQMMADGSARDAAVRVAERAVEEAYRAKVASEMRYETAVYKYTSTIVTTSSAVHETSSVTRKTTASAAEEADEAKSRVTARTDEARRERDRESEALEAERLRGETLAAEARALENARLEKELYEVEERKRMEMEYASLSSSSMSSISKTATMASTTSTSTSTSSSMSSSTTRFSNANGAFEYVEAVPGSSAYKFEGIPGYFVPLLLFMLFTVAVVEGLGDVFHL